MTYEEFISVNESLKNYYNGTNCIKINKFDTLHRECSIRNMNNCTDKIVDINMIISAIYIDRSMYLLNPSALKSYIESRNKANNINFSDANTPYEVFLKYNERSKNIVSDKIKIDKVNGTKCSITNLVNNKSAVVEIKELVNNIQHGNCYASNPSLLKYYFEQKDGSKVCKYNLFNEIDNIDDFIKWAHSVKLHPDIIAFFENKPEWLSLPKTSYGLNARNINMLDTKYKEFVSKKSDEFELGRYIVNIINKDFARDFIRYLLDNKLFNEIDNIDDFIKWTHSENLHSDIVAFFKNKPEWLSLAKTSFGLNVCTLKRLNTKYKEFVVQKSDVLELGKYIASITNKDFAKDFIMYLVDYNLI